MLKNKKIEKYKNVIENIISILICCVLFSGSSVLVSYIYIILIGIFLCVLVKGVINKKISIFIKYRYNILLLSIITLWIIRIPFLRFQDESLKYIISFCLMFGISIQLKDDNKIIERIMKYILYFSIGLSVSIVLSQFIDDFCIKYFSYLIPRNSYSLEMYYNELKSGIYSGLSFERAYAATNLTLGISVIYVRLISDKKNNILDLFILILLFIALFSTGKRMHLLINIFNFIFIFFLNAKKERILKFLRILIILILALLFLLMKIPTAQKVFVRIFDENSNYTVESRQENFWEYCIEMFNNRPIIGYGVKSFKNYISNCNTDKIYDAHNIYLQILAENGIIGIILFMWLFISVFYSSVLQLRRRYNSDYNKNNINYSLLLQSSFLIYGLSGNPLFNISQLMIYFIAIIILNNTKNEGDIYEKNINSYIS